MFTTKACVYIRDRHILEECVAWCENRGYDAGCPFTAYRHYVAVNINRPGHVDVLSTPPRMKGVINCQDNVSIFKALAAMNDTEAIGQWYVCGTPKIGATWAFARTQAALDWIALAPAFRRATARELCGYFLYNSKHQPHESE